MKSEGGRLFFRRDVRDFGARAVVHTLIEYA